MAPRKKKSNRQRNAPPPPPPPPPVLSSSTSPPGECVANLPSSSSRPEASPSPISEHSFLIQYSDGDLSWSFNCRDPDALAINEVKEALAQTLDTVCSIVNLSRDELSVYTSFPTSIGKRSFTVREWLSLARQPCVTIRSNPKVGLLQQRDEAKQRLQQVLEEKEEVIRDGLSSLVMVKSQESSDQCEGCSQLQKKVADLEGDNANLRISNGHLELLVSDTEKLLSDMGKSFSDFKAETIKQTGESNKVFASLLHEMSALKRRTGQILRRIIIQDARKKIVKHFGDNASFIGNYNDYFTTHEADTMALGVSRDLLNLLKDGTWGLNKAAHLAPKKDKAIAVMELEGTSRKAFKEAFQFAYEESVDVYWEKKD